MLRLSPEEFDGLRARINAAMSANHTPVRSQKNRKSKYGNVVTWVDGLRFDSKDEAKRFVQLREMERLGKISHLRLQVPFDLLPAQEIDGKKERPVKYVADFVYLDSRGKEVIEDVKSGPTKTKEFIIKRKLMMFVHHKAVVEVMGV